MHIPPERVWLFGCVRSICMVATAAAGGSTRQYAPTVREWRKNAKVSAAAYRVKWVWIEAIYATCTWYGRVTALRRAFGPSAHARISDSLYSVQQPHRMYSELPVVSITTLFAIMCELTHIYTRYKNTIY